MIEVQENGMESYEMHEMPTDLTKEELAQNNPEIPKTDCATTTNNSDDDKNKESEPLVPQILDKSRNQKVDIDVDETSLTGECENNDLITQKDLSEVSRTIPPGKWRQILVECFGITEEDIYKAEYACKGEGLETTILNALITWQQNRPERLAKTELYNILRKAVEKNIVKNSSWCDFLLPNAPCKVEPETVIDCKVPSLKNQLISELKSNLGNSLHWYIMITTCIIQLFYIDMTHGLLHRVWLLVEFGITTVILFTLLM